MISLENGEIKNLFHSHIEKIPVLSEEEIDCLVEKIAEAPEDPMLVVPELDTLVFHHLYLAQKVMRLYHPGAAKEPWHINTQRAHIGLYYYTRRIGEARKSYWGGGEDYISTISYWIKQVVHHYPALKRNLNRHGEISTYTKLLPEFLLQRSRDEEEFKRIWKWTIEHFPGDAVTLFKQQDFQYPLKLDKDDLRFFLGATERIVRQKGIRLLGANGAD